MRVVVTRPAQDAARWAQDLRAGGRDVLELPLIAIAPLPSAALDQARAALALARYRAVMFVSANAVEQFLAAASAWPAGVRAWATGPGTVRALRAAGVPAAQIDAPDHAAAQFDSEALWGRVGAGVAAGGAVLIVRGAGADGQAAGRGWLAERLSQAGARVDEVAAYARALPRWSATVVQQAAQAAADGSVWLFSSSEAIDNLGRLLPGQDWSGARAVATHERIAQAARAAGFGVVVPSRPDLQAVVGALESLG